MIIFVSSETKNIFKVLKGCVERSSRCFDFKLNPQLSEILILPRFNSSSHFPPDESDASNCTKP